MGRMGATVAVERDNPSDRAVARAVCRGERTAFGVLVDRYLPDVYAVAARIVCNGADAEDVAQEAFLRAFERLDQYDVERSFRNWILKIATNTALNHLRSRRRRRDLHLRWSESSAAPSADAREPGNPDVPSRAEWTRWLGQLDDRHRTAIVLFHFHEMPYAEVAEAMGVPLNTVRTYLHRGRKRLRELMTGESNARTGSWNVAM